MASVQFFTEGTPSDGDSNHESQIRRRILRRRLRITSSVSPVRVSSQHRSRSRVRFLRGADRWGREIFFPTSVSPSRSRSRSHTRSPLRRWRSTSSSTLSVQVPFAEVGPTQFDSSGDNEASSRIRRRELRITSSISPQRAPVRRMTRFSFASAMQVPFTEFSPTLIDSDSGSED